MELGEALGAVAALQQEGLAGGDIGQPLLQPPRLAGEDQRRVAMQGLLDALQCGLVGISGHLPYRQAAPAAGDQSRHGVSFPQRARALGVDHACKTSGVGGRSTFGDIRFSTGMKQKSRLGGAASVKTCQAQS